MTTLRWRQGATGATAPIGLAAEGGTLQGATIVLRAQSLDGTETLVDDVACDIADADARTVTYERSADDVADTGRYRAAFLVTFADGSQQWFPEEGWVLLIIEPDGSGA